MRLFLCSVFKELREWRQAVVAQLEQLNVGGAPIRMEVFPASPHTPRDVCLREISRADLVIVLVGETYGEIEPSAGISYTHLEVREAIRLARPVLPFFATDLSPVPGDAPGVERMKQELLRAATARYSTRNSISGDVVTAVWRFVQDHGEGGPYRTFQSADIYFKHFLRESLPFNHAWPLVGRDREVGSLLAFLSGSGVVACLMGAGGVGKSKILLEVARRFSGTVRFLAEGGSVNAETIKELPQGRLCVVIDDCHRVPVSILELIKACRIHNPECRFLLSARPVGRGAILRAVSALAPDEQLVLPELKPLDPKTEARQLAEAALGGTLREHASRLAHAANGNPLVITVGGRCLAQGKLSLELLDQHEEFQRAVLDRLLEDVPTAEGSALEMCRLLEVVAAVGPTRTDERVVRKLVAEFCGAPEDVIARRLDTLIAAGYLLQRGSLARVTPDVLSDHLMFRASVTAGGQSTGFVERIYRAFVGVALSNILRNAAELEWRCQAGGRRVDVLGDIWADILQALPEMRHSSRAMVVKALGPAAIYMPERVLELASWLVAHPDAPAELETGFPTELSGQNAALRELPELLQQAAQHPEHSRAVARLLWTIGRSDSRSLPQHPSHAVRVLEGLASYRKHQAAEVQLGVLQAMGDVLEAGDELTWSPVSVARAALKREAEHSYSEGYTFHLQAIGLNVQHPVIAAIRSRAVTMLRRIALGGRPKHATDAVTALGGLLHPPHGSYGRTITDAEDAHWRREARGVTSLLGEVATETRRAVVRHVARQQLIERRARGWQDLTPDIEATLGGIATTDDDTLARILCGVEGLARNENRLEAEQRLRGQALEFGAKLWVEEGSIDRILVRIRPVGDEVAAAEMYSENSFGALCEGLANARPAAAKDLLNALSSADTPWLRKGAIGVLRHYTVNVAFDQLVASILALASSEHEDVRAVVAWNCRSLLWKVPLEAGVLSVFERYGKDASMWVRTGIMNSVGVIADGNPKDALEIILETDFACSGQVADAACLWLDRQGGIDLDSVASNELKQLIAKLQRLDSIGDQHYNTWEFLKEAVEREPVAVAEMLLARIDASATTEVLGDFEPLPYISEEDKSELWHAPDPVVDQAFAAVLDEARERLLRPEWQYGHFVPALLRLLCPDVEHAVANVAKWTESGDAERIARAAIIFKNYPRSVLYTHHEVVAKLLLGAARSGSECYERTLGELISIAASGVTSSHGGEDPPRFIEDRDNASAAAERYADLPTVARFYQAVRNHAVRELERYRRRFAEDAVE